MKITLIIPTYGRTKSLGNCLASLATCQYPPDEVLIIDQNGGDNYSENEAGIALVQKAMTSVLFKHVFAKEQSLTAARNLGIKESTGDVLVFSDDDVEFMPDSFSCLRSFFSDEGNCLIGAQDLLIEKKGASIFSYLFDLKEINPHPCAYYTKSMLGRLPKKVGERSKAKWAMGYCFAVRKNDVIQSSVFFDENMKRYAYGEDLDFTMRLCRYAKSNKKNCFYTNKFPVKHHSSMEYRIPSIETLLSFFGNRYYILKKNKLRFNIPFFYLSNIGYFLVYKLTRQKEDRLNLKKAYRLFKRNRKAIEGGDLDYVKMLNESIAQ